MSYSIKRVVVIGSGTMGGGIAAHVANAGLPVYLLDLTQSIVSANFDRLKKSKPPSFFTPQTADLIRVGNLTDNFSWVGEADWIVEAIVENLQAKRELVARIKQVRKPSSIVSSNTSGLPISAIAAETSSDFKRNFLGTHFFNPPRYMKLLEVIPTADTDPRITEFMQTFAEDRLGKGVVIAKDTPSAWLARHPGIELTMSESDRWIDPVHEGVDCVLRYGQLYGPGTHAERPSNLAPLHVDAAAYAALLAVDRGAGTYNIAEENPHVATERARRELDWRPEFRLPS